MSNKEIIERQELVPVKPVPKLSEFYRNKTLFITGFTGFVAQAFVEKLLWVFPDIKCVYLLIRSKKNVSVQQRLSQLLEGDCFDRLRNRDDSFKNKLIPIEGDMVLPNLGMSEQDRIKVINETNIVIHSAATVNFNDYLTTCIDINIKGTKALLDLATDMPHLEVFSHISSSYTNSDRVSQEIEEKVYEPKYDWKTIIKVRDQIDPSTVNILSEKLEGTLPNTYTFSKSLAEHMVYEYASKIPTIILRPSIVSQTLNEPKRGWCCNINGPAGVALGTATGMLRVNFSSPHIKSDYIPCDIVTDVTLFMTALRPFQRKEVKPIYHICTCDLSVTTHEFKTYGMISVRRLPAKYTIWYPNIELVNSSTKFYLMFILYQLIPALFFDVLLKLARKNVSLVRLQLKTYNMILGYSYFMTNEFKFDNSNSYFLDKYVSSEDRKKIKIAYKRTDIPYQDHFDDNVRYIEERFLNQKPEDRPQAERLVNTLYVLDCVLKYGFMLFVGFYTYNSQLIPRFLYGTYEFVTNFNL